MSIGINQQNFHRSCIHFVACLHLLAVTSSWLEEKSSVMRRRALASHFLVPSKDARLWFHAESWKLTPTSASIGWSGMLACNYCRRIFVCQLTVSLSTHSHHSQWVASRFTGLFWEKGRPNHESPEKNHPFDSAKITGRASIKQIWPNKRHQEVLYHREMTK